MQYTSELVYTQMWNEFDEWGLLLSQPRINYETIPAYRARLEDVVLHRGGANHLNLFYGINRDLGLTVYHDALIVQTAKRNDGLAILPDVTVEVRANGINISTAAFRVIREAELIPTDTLRVKLAKSAVSREIIVESPIGTRLGPDEFKFDWRRNELVFNKDEYAGLTITISYLYYEVVPTHQRTLQQVIDGLNAITTPGGELVVTAAIKDSVSASLEADGLPLLPPTIVDQLHVNETGEYYGSYRIPCGEASMRSLGDPDFIDTMMGNGDTYFNTELIRWVEQVRNLARTGWENLLFDQTRITDRQGLAVVPTLADPKTTYYRTSSPSDSETFSAIEAYELDYTTGDLPLNRRGFADVEMRSGVGGKDDLKLVVEDGTQSLQFTPTIYDFYTTPANDIVVSGDGLVV